MGVLLAHGVPYIPTPMGLPDLSHQLQRWHHHLALAGPLMWGQGNLCEVLRTQGQRGPSIWETLPLPGGTNIKRGYLYGLLPSHGLRPICLVQPGPARPLEALPTAEKWGGPCNCPTRDMGTEDPKTEAGVTQFISPRRPLPSMTQ